MVFIVDDDAPILPYERRNYNSATSGPAFEFVNNLIHDELKCGKLKTSKIKPHCIHSIGAVPKKDGVSWRPITDCSRPSCESINAHMSSTFKEICYSSVDQVVNMLQPGFWMASIDISIAPS